jgi:hypothetical protein
MPARTIARRTEGRSARAVARHQPKSSVALRHSPNARPIWDEASGRSAATESVAQTGAAGTSADNGSGIQGNGTDATNGDEPCGFVTFSDPHGSHYDTRTHGFWVDIRMSVHFADGSSQSMVLDYPWYYPSEADNPWSDQNLRDPNFPTRFQPPPVDKAGGEPPLVQYVVAHSTPEGMTLLKDCPQPSPSPAR